MRLSLLATIVVVLCSASASAQYTDRTRDGDAPVVAPKIEHVGVSEHLGDRIPVDVPFIDEQGRQVTQIGRAHV